MTSLFFTLLVAAELLGGRALCVLLRKVLVSCVSKKRITPDASFSESPRPDDDVGGALKVRCISSMVSPLAEGGCGRLGAKISEQKSSKVVGQTHFRVKPLM